MQGDILRSIPLVLLFAGVRFCFSGAGLLLIGNNFTRDLKRTPWKPLAGLALTQTFIQYVFFYQAVAVSSASLAALLVATGSFWWMLFSPLFLKTPWPTARQWITLIIGGIGVTLAVYAPGASAGQPVTGAILMLLATASGALALVFFARVKPTMSAINATGFSLLLGGIGLSLAGIREIFLLPQIFSLPVIIATVWLSFVSAAAFSIWNHLSTVFPVTVLASYRFLIPLCGVVESLIFLQSETADWGLLIGGSLVITSLVLAKRLS